MSAIEFGTDWHRRSVPSVALYRSGLASSTTGGAVRRTRVRVWVGSIAWTVLMATVALLPAFGPSVLSPHDRPAIHVGAGVSARP